MVVLPIAIHFFVISFYEQIAVRVMPVIIRCRFVDGRTNEQLTSTRQKKKTNFFERFIIDEIVRDQYTYLL